MKLAADAPGRDHVKFATRGGQPLTAAGTGQQRTALASIGAAVALVALKLGTGIATGSLSLISAGIESSGDVVAAVPTFLAVRLGGRPADAALLAIALAPPAIKEVHDVNVSSTGSTGTAAASGCRSQTGRAAARRTAPGGIFSTA
jgi:cation efflux family protein